MLSIGLNALLILALVGVGLWARNKIESEKLATFAGCLGALTYSLAPADQASRMKRAALALASMLPNLEAEEFRWRITRASILRASRGEPVFAEIAGEGARAMFLGLIKTTVDADRVWGGIDEMLADESKPVKEPHEMFEEKDLAAAQFQIEAEMLQMYRAAVRQRPTAEG